MWDQGFKKEFKDQGVTLTAQPCRDVFAALRAGMKPGAKPPRIAVHMACYGYPPRNEADLVKAYVARGGIFAYASDIETDFITRYNPSLGWKNNGYFRTTSTITPRGKEILSLKEVAASFSAKSVWLKDVPAHQALYSTSENSQHQSLAMQMQGETTVGPGLCSVAVDDRRGQGEGVFVYIGDVNGEPDSVAVMAGVVKYAV